MTEAVVRRACAGGRDAALVAPLFDGYRQYYGQRPDPAVALAYLSERLAAEDSVILVACTGGAAAEQAVGFTQLYPSFSSVAARRIWILNDLFVEIRARRAGVGRALMEAACEHALTTGAARLILDTAVDNRSAQALYESLGYRCQNDAFRYYSLELTRPAMDP